MHRKTRMAIGNVVIATGSIVGGVLLTNHLVNEQSSAFASGTGSTSSPSDSSSPAPSDSASPSASATPTQAVPKTKTGDGDPISYMYGTIQVEVIKTGSKISAINMLQSDATNGRAQAFPILIDAAIKANGSNFGNLSGATFTTDAFKQALDSAIKNLG